MALNHELIDNPDSLISKEQDTLSTFDSDMTYVNQLISSHDIHALKKLIRSHNWGLDHPVRSFLWKQLSSLYNARRRDSRPEDVILEKTPPTSPKKLPSFIDVTYCRFYHLNNEGLKMVDKVVWSLARDHPEVTFCPLVFPMTALFLHFMSPIETFHCISQLVQANTPVKNILFKNDDHDNRTKKQLTRPLLPKSKAQISKDAFVLIKSTQSVSISFWPQRGLIRKQRENLSKRNDIDPAIQEWLKWIFIGLPFPHLVRVVDCFLVEGFKFLLRTGIAILVLLKKQHDISQDSMTLDQMIAFCGSLPVTPNQLIRLACSLSRVTTSKIVKQYRRADDAIRQNPEMSGLTPQPSPAAMRRGDMVKMTEVHITSRVAPRTVASSIVDWYDMDQLWEWIPDRIAVKEPVLLFTTQEDGCSLRTFYTKVESHEPTILLIKTTKREVFGAFCADSWANRESGHYFGTGETFLFSLKPDVAKYAWSDAEARSSIPGARKAAASSQLFMSGTATHIIIGSGNGSGIWLDEDLTRGKSERCDTFKNRPLASSKDFCCTILEVIGFN